MRTLLTSFIIALAISHIACHSWNTAFYDNTGSIGSIVPSRDGLGSPTIFVGNGQGDVYSFNLETSLSKSLHALRDSNYFGESVNAIGASGEANMLFACSNLNLWSSRPTEGADTVWLNRGNVSNCGTILPMLTQSGLEVLIGAYTSTPSVSYSLSLYDPFLKTSIYTYTTTGVIANTCGPIRNVITTENYGTGNPDLWIILEQCIYRYASAVNPGLSVQASGLLKNITAASFTNLDKTLVVYSGLSTSTTVNSKIYFYIATAPVSFTYATGQGVGATYITVGQTNATNDAVAVGMTNGDILICSLTKFLASGGTTPTCTSIGMSYLPVPNSQISTLKFGVVKEGSTVKYVLISVRESGYVHAYDFGAQMWVMLASPANWDRGINPSATKSVHVVGHLSTVEDPKLLLNYQGGLYFLDKNNEDYDSWTFYNADPPQDSSTYTKRLSNDSITDVSVSSSALGTISFLQLSNFVNQKIAVSLLLVSTCNPAVNMTLQVKGYTMNSQLNRGDTQRVIYYDGTTDTASIRYSGLKTFWVAADNCNYQWTQTTVGADLSGPQAAYSLEDDFLYNNGFAHLFR